MRQRRNKRNFKSIDLLDKLQIISKILLALIVICLIIFINTVIHRNSSTVISKNDNIVENDFAQNTAIISTNTPAQNSILEETNTDLNANDNSLAEQLSKEPTTSTSKNTNFTMTFTGDIMCQNTIYNDALNKDTNTYDFSYIFEDIKYFIQTGDIAIGSLETTFSGPSKGYSGSSRFNTPESLAYNLKKLGFDVLTTANNHCFDYGYEGLESTINYLDAADISHTGTYTSEEEKNNILIRNVKGVNIAFLSFTYGTNGINVPSDKSYSVNLIDEQNILNQLSLAKNQNPDLICVSMHWGTEFQTTPNSEQKDLANLLFKNGANIIIGNHPNVLQPMEKRTVTLDDGTTKDGFVAYSLGNFLSDQTKNYAKDSVILNLGITKSSEGKISIDSATYVPIYIDKNTKENSQKYKIIDLKNVIKSVDAGYNVDMDKNLYNTYKTQLENIKKLIGEEIK